MSPDIGWPIIITLVAFWILIRIERKPKDNIHVPRKTLWERTRELER